MFRIAIYVFYYYQPCTNNLHLISIGFTMLFVLVEVSCSVFLRCPAIFTHIAHYALYVVRL